MKPTEPLQQRLHQEMLGHTKETHMRVPHRDGGHHYVLTEREGGLPQLRVTDLRNGQSHRVTFPEPVYNAAPGANAGFDTTNFRYGYE